MQKTSEKLCLSYLHLTTSSALSNGDLLTGQSRTNLVKRCSDASCTTVSLCAAAFPLSRSQHSYTDDLRAAILKSHTTEALCTMFKKGETALNHAAFDFLDIMSNYREHVFLCITTYAKKI